MNVYETVISLNRRLIEGDTITPAERQTASELFLANVSDRRTVTRFHNGVNAPGPEDGRRMYPEFFIPPYNEGKKYVTVTGVTPKTHILSSNAYELEILRLLALFSPDNEIIKSMLHRTRERLATTCFAGSCYLGECCETGLVALRFLSSVFASDLVWQRNLTEKAVAYLDDKKRHSGTRFYLWLTLSELSDGIALPVIKTFEGELCRLLGRSFIIKSDYDCVINTQCKYILRNCLSRLDKYAFLTGRRPYVSERDGRLYFDTSINQKEADYSV